MRANTLSAYAMMVMASGGTMRTSPKSKVNKLINEEPNNHKKCFRGPCSNTRNGNKLYCSAYCANLDKFGI